MRYETLILQALTRIWWYSFDGLVMVLALWRLSNLVANESGPWRCFKRLRLLAAFICQGPEDEADRTWLNKACREFHLHDMLECEYCNSMWLAPLLMLGYHVGGHTFAITFLSWLALSTTTIFLKRTHEKLQR